MACKTAGQHEILRLADRVGEPISAPSFRRADVTSGISESVSGSLISRRPSFSSPATQLLMSRRSVVRQRSASHTMHKSMSEKFTRPPDFLNDGRSVRLKSPM